VSVASRFRRACDTFLAAIGLFAVGLAITIDLIIRSITGTEDQ